MLVLGLTVANAQLSAGKKAPDFTLNALDGKSYTLSNFFKKPAKIVVLDIWATWCPPCKAEVPYLIDLHKKYSGKDVQIIGVAIDNDKSTVSEFAKSKNINYLVLHDSDAQKVEKPYNVKSIPTTYIIDKKGVIRYVHSGFSGKNDATKIENEIKTLLAEK